jgi:UDP-glucose 4-epimerase
VYAGSHDPPFTAGSVPLPTSAYGNLTLNKERALIFNFANRGHITTVIGRISNLYGPGQNLGKLQGLISHLILAALTKKTMNVFVPLDTIRDFVFVNDAAHVINTLTTMDSPPEIAVIASGEPKSLATVISQVQGVIRTKIPIAYGEHASSSAQVADLRMVPTIPCDQLTPFPAGVKTMQLDLAQRLQENDGFLHNN